MKQGLVVFVVFVVFGLAAGGFAFFAGWVCAGDTGRQIPCLPITSVSLVLFFFYVVAAITVGRVVTQDLDMNSSLVHSDEHA